MFVFDVAITVTLYLMVSRLASLRKARATSILWFLNPFAMFAIELLGVPDVIATLLTLLAVSFLVRKHEIVAGTLLAGGIWIKLFPILLIPPVFLYAKERLKTSVKSLSIMGGITLSGLAAYLSWVFPTGEFSLAPFTSYSPITQPMSAMFVFAPPSYISAASVALVILYFTMWLFAKRISGITDTILPVLLVYYTFSNPYPQYFLWVLPFLTLDVILVKRERLKFLVITLCLALGAWFIENSGYLTPSGYSLFLIPLEGKNLPWYTQLIDSFLKSPAAGLVEPLLFSALYASIFIYALEVARGWFVSRP